MNKRDWYLDKITSRIPGIREKRQVREEIEDHLREHAESLIRMGKEEDIAWNEAIDTMGDSDWLAQEMGRLHPYDTAAAWSRTVNVLWAGLMLFLLFFGNASMQVLMRWLGRCLLFYSLFRMRSVNGRLRQAFLWLCGEGIFAGLAAVRPALIWETPAWVMERLCISGGAVMEAGMMISLCIGIYDYVEEGQKRDLKILLGYEIISCAGWVAGALISLLTGNRDRLTVDIAVSDGWLWLVMLAAVVVVVCLFVFCLIRSWQIRGTLCANDEPGVEPVNVYRLAAGELLFLSLTLLPLFASAFISLASANLVSGEVYQGAAYAQEALWQSVSDRLTADPAWPRAQGEEILKTLRELLPQEELVRLDEARTIRTSVIGMDGLEGESVLLFATYPEKDGGHSHRIGCLTVLDGAERGFAAAEGLLSQWECYSELTGTEQRFFYRKGGQTFQFPPRKKETIHSMLAAEFPIKAGADAVYSYQAGTFACATSRGKVVVGVNRAVQTSLFRIPFASVDFVPLMTQALTYGNRIAFQEGIIYDRTTAIWKQKGEFKSFSCN